jgi:hypothetical protein
MCSSVSLLYFSVTPQNLTVIIIAPVWKTPEHHEKFLQDSSYPTFLSTLAAAHSGPPLSVLHFDMTDDPAKGLTAPVTDLTYMTLKEGKTKADVEPFFANFAWIADLGKGFHHGQCVEKPELFVVLMGWASVEVSVDLQYASLNIDINMK